MNGSNIKRVIIACTIICAIFFCLPFIATIIKAENSAQLVEGEIAIFSLTVSFNYSNIDSSGGGMRSYWYTITQINNQPYFAVEPEEPRRNGYTFGGWYTEQAFINIYDFTTPLTDDLSLYAKWDVTPIPTPRPGATPTPSPLVHRFNLTFNAMGGVFSNGAERIGYNGIIASIFEPEAPIKSGYVFGGWYHDSDCAEEVDFINHGGRYWYSSGATLFAGWVLSDINSTYPSHEPGVEINGETIAFFYQRPIIVDGRTLVPIRGVFEELGFNVVWDEHMRQIVLSSDENIIVIAVGSDIFAVNGESYNLDVPAQIINGRTMLPLRALLESINISTEWDSARNVVVVSTAIE